MMEVKSCIFFVFLFTAEDCCSFLHSNCMLFTVISLSHPENTNNMMSYFGFQ